jgi:hypothetical protein
MIIKNLDSSLAKIVGPDLIRIQQFCGYGSKGKEKEENKK